MCTKPDCDVLITYRPAYAAAAITCKCSELDSGQRERFGCEAARRVQAAGGLAADPLILYRENSDLPAMPTRLSEIPEKRRARLANAVGEVKTCISCRYCQLEAGIHSTHECVHPLSVDRLTGQSLRCRDMYGRGGECGYEGLLWEPISATEERCA